MYSEEIKIGDQTIKIEVTVKIKVIESDKKENDEQKRIGRTGNETSLELSERQLAARSGENDYSSTRLVNVSSRVGLSKSVQRKHETNEKLRSFIACYARLYNCRYECAPEGLRDKAVIGRLQRWIENIPQERAHELIETYFKINYRPINESQHDLWQFIRHLNRIGNAANGAKDATEINWNDVWNNEL